MRPTVLLLCLASAPSAWAASDAAAIGLAPLGGILAIGAIGGAGTTLILAFEDGSVHPALRNIALGCAGINVAGGTAGLIAAGFLDDDDPQTLAYVGGGVVLGLGLVGGLLALTTDAYAVRDDAALHLTPTAEGWQLGWTGAF